MKETAIITEGRKKDIENLRFSNFPVGQDETHFVIGALPFMFRKKEGNTMFYDDMLEPINPRSNSPLDRMKLVRRARLQFRQMFGEPDELTQAMWDAEDKCDAMVYRHYAELEAKQKKKPVPADDYTFQIKSTIKVKK